MMKNFEWAWIFVMLLDGCSEDKGVICGAYAERKNSLVVLLVVSFSSDTVGSNLELFSEASPETYSRVCVDQWMRMKSWRRGPRLTEEKSEEREPLGVKVHKRTGIALPAPLRTGVLSLTSGCPLSKNPDGLDTHIGEVLFTHTQIHRDTHKAAWPCFSPSEGGLTLQEGSPSSCHRHFSPPPLVCLPRLHWLLLSRLPLTGSVIVQGSGEVGWVDVATVIEEATTHKIIEPGLKWEKK
ncbi:hypothetical protein FQN60_016273 [Etheostoma spectabile]|uniref:Uncharacterized protein n=1 Tax=Etheostoma spectabile TaxID=54343 RepID=A0A5J5D764_9PERO|nr:hypothetical protein FQN60_016273 [Etheostoma spectabile]